MFILFLLIFVIFTAVWLFFSLSVIYHLRQYSLPGWTAARYVVPCFFIVSAVFFLAAGYFLATIPYETLDTFHL